MKWDRQEQAAEIDSLDRQVLGGIQALVDKGLLIGSVGNVSARTDDIIRITPTRVPYAEMRPTDLVTYQIDGLGGGSNGRPSIELPLHLALYRSRPDVRAIVHTHPPHSTAWSFLGIDLDPTTEDNTYYGVGPVRSAAWEPSGSKQLARRAVSTLGESHAVLLGRHGLLATADTVELAVVRTSVVEHQAHIAWLLRAGKVTTAQA